MNDMLTKDSYTVVPLVDRGRVSAHANTLGGVVLNTWDSELWNAADWYRIK
jgi:peptide/nickel transport system substrate-binding protein